MYARCTHCKTIFRVTEEQLKIAKGYVRCGVCEQPFNALQNIEEKSMADTTENHKTDPSQATLQPKTEHAENTPSEPTQFQTKNWFSGKLGYQGNKPENSKHSTQDKSSEEQNSEIISDDDQEIFFKERSHVFTVIGGIDHIWQDASETPEDLIKQSVQVEPQPAFATKSFEETPEPEEIQDPASDDEFIIMDNHELARQLISDLEDHNKDIIDIDIPPVTSVITEEELIKEHKHPAPTKLTKEQIRSIAIWSGGYVAALLILCLQIVYAMRIDLAKHNEVRPLLEAMCSVTHCKLPPRRSPEEIELTSRSVRVHPYEYNALLIEASFENKAQFTQAYPVIELVLHNYSGNLIGKRQFKPKEYVDNKPKDMLLRPEEEANLVLELVSPGKDIASFKFNFL